MNNNLNNNIPHRDNADAFSQVQASQIIDTTSSLIYDAFSEAQASEIIDTTSSQKSLLMSTTSPRDVTQFDSNILAPQKYIPQIHEIIWVSALKKMSDKEYYFVHIVMYKNMRLHFIVKDEQTQKYKKWYLSIPKEKPIVEGFGSRRKDDNDLWEYLKVIRDKWIPYNGGEFYDNPFLHHYKTQ